MAKSNEERTKKPRACTPCHLRKVKCDASQVGLPCTHCSRRGKIHDCQLAQSSISSISRSRKRKLDGNRLPQEYIWSIQGPSDNLDYSELLDHRTSVPASTHHEFPDSTAGTPVSEHNDSAARPVLAGSEADCVVEEDTPLETCRRIVHCSEGAYSPFWSAHPGNRREVLEYHEGVTSMTILGELFGQQKRGKFVRLLLYDSAQMTRGCSDGMSKGVTDFLHQQGAFVLPPHKTCQKLLRLYFERVYPYTPVLNRVDFVCQYMNETYSTFLFQCILTSVAPYMSSLMLAECGYMDRASAQKSFFAKAQLLYDLDAEKSQVSLLQGSLILTSSYFAFGLDKDCRYWLANAVRLATQMGLHRKQIAEQLEPPAQELFARIFWVTFNKDVLMAISGRNNVRRLIDQHCDIAELRAEDFIEDDLTDHHHWRNILPTKTFLQHLYLVHNTTLSKLCARFISTVRVPSPVAQNYRPRDFEHELVQWRKALPYELRPESVTAWTHDNHWILVLRAMSYRFESVLWREERKLHDFDEGRTMLRKQQDAMLELDMILERFMLHNLVELCPFSMATCAATLVAMHIEIALSPLLAVAKPRTYPGPIHSGLAFLRNLSEHWHTTKWTLRMFDAIVAGAELTLDGPGEQSAALHTNQPDLCTDELHSERTQARRVGSKFSAVETNQVQKHAVQPGHGVKSTCGSIAALDEDFLHGPLTMHDEPEKWLDELLSEDIFTMNNV